jgi:hypothetical protein
VRCALHTWQQLCVLNGMASKLVFSVWIAGFERCICGAMSETHPAVPMTGLSSSLRAAETVRLHGDDQLPWTVSNNLCAFTGCMPHCMRHASGGGHAMRQA